MRDNQLRLWDNRAPPIPRGGLTGEAGGMDSKTQSAHIVSTRVQPPTYTDALVTRDRLIGVLRTGVTKKLAHIHAPAGFGKTTLAVQWERVLKADGLPVAWLSLDREDNDVASFLGHFIEAVRRAEADLCTDLRDILETDSADAERYVLAEMVNQFAEYRHQFVIILDDWHFITDADTTAALEFLLDVGPDNLHLIITSRTRTPAIGRLKVANQVTEIDATQLRFDQSESEAFLLQHNDLQLTGNDVHRLWSSTDGWIAALQLATLSLRNTDNPAALIDGFSGRHHSIGDYLAENVLDALPPDVLDFLLTTSICDRICGDLAAAVSGRSRGRAILDDLERRDMFLRPLDDNREWFRYHHLFADYLRRRLERDHAGRIVGLHRTASAWFATQGMLTEAVNHALAAGDGIAAVNLVEDEGMHLVELSRMASLLGLVHRLPRDLVLARPALQIAIAWANCLLHRPGESQIALEHVRSALAEATDERSAALIGEADVVQACNDVYGDRIGRAAGLVAPYLAEGADCRAFLVAVSANIRTFVDIHTFAFDEAQSLQQRANVFHAAASGPFAGVYGRCFAGLAAFAQLDLVTTEQRYTEARDLAQNAAGSHSHAARLAGALLGRLAYERGDIETAELLLEECHELGAESGVADFMIATYGTLARIRALRGDTDDALSLLDEGGIAAQQLSLPRLSAALDLEAVRIHLCGNDIDSAEAIVQSQQTVPAIGTDGIAIAIRQYQSQMQARVMSAHGNYAGAHAVLTQVRGESAHVGWRYAEVVNSLELTRVLVLAGDNAAAAAALAPALNEGARCGLVRTVIDTGAEPLRIVGEMRTARRGPADYLATLLAAARADAENAPAAERPDEHSAQPEEPLTARETDILHLLERGMSNKQIARTLGVTVNTVKWYLKSIYIKLGVVRRGEAVAEARRRRILE